MKGLNAWNDEGFMLIRGALLWASRREWLAAQMRRRSFARRAVQRFMPGETLEEAIAAAQEMEMGAVLTNLGENVTTVAEAEAVASHYRDAARRIVAEGVDAELSLKPTHLGIDVGEDHCREAVRSIVEATQGRAGTVWIDMEDASYVDRTLDLLASMQGAGTPVGVCLQAYLHRTPADLERVLAMGAPVRLVKGAYREPPSLALQKKREVDEAFLALGRTMSHRPPTEGRHVLGTHDERMIRSLVGDEFAGLAGSGAPEVHMLYGIATDLQGKLFRAGVTVRILISYGSHWFPWYMRRLAERPANLLFLMKALVRR